MDGMIWIAWSRFNCDSNWVEGFDSMEKAMKAISPGMIKGEDYLILNDL